LNDDPEIKDVLMDILKWTKFQGMQQVKQVLETTLDNETKKLVYELSDGMSSPAIARIAKVSPPTVRDYWKLWAPMGIVEIHPDYKKRYRRVFSLEEVGIAVPVFKEPNDESDDESIEDE
jgi:hypothetical protein